MGLKARMWILFILISIIHAGGILIFIKGFLLKRSVVLKNNTCHVDFTMKVDNHEEEGCWMHRRFQKAIVIIIDALRFDFAYYNTSIIKGQELPFENKLKIIHEKLIHSPQKSRLYRFIADPPTTTLQRLKGLTTGSLPTFVDAGSNFASSEITEDNIIDQLRRQQKSIVQMGDDTWEGLFPNRFIRSYPFPSFNVKDLHTVDNGIIKNLIPELKKSGWDMLIAHFLGVDHCGHRFGPYHPVMGEKLTQMNDVLRSVIKTMDNDTVLFVLGDHGMTRTGDHGGDSKDEVDAALFVYSPSKLTETVAPKLEDSPSVSQIDLVPTMSLLLGVPVPFSNLGMIIPELFDHGPWAQAGTSEVKQVFHKIKALRLNAHQVKEYLHAYSLISEDFPKHQYKDLNTLFSLSENELQRLIMNIYHNGEHEDLLSRLEKLETNYKSYLTNVRGMCQGIWAKFDTTSMSLGLFLTCFSIGITVFQLFHTNSQERFEVAFWTSTAVSGWSSAFVAVLWFSLMEAKTAIMLGTMFFGFSIILIVGFIIYKLMMARGSEQSSTPSLSGYFSIHGICAILITFMYFCGFFSNSYVVFEDSMSSFLLQSLLWIQSTFIYAQQCGTEPSKQISEKKRAKFDIFRTLTNRKMKPLYLALTFNLCVRLSMNFRACREEQWTCETSSFLLPLSSFTDSIPLKNARYFFSVIAIILPSIGLRWFLKHYGNLNGKSLLVLSTKYCIPIGMLFIALYWALQALPPQVLDSLPVTRLFPRIVYVANLITIVAVFVNPLSIYILPKATMESHYEPTAKISNNIIPQMYNQMKDSLNELSENEHKTTNGAETSDDVELPVVYGLATVYSSAMIIFTAAVTEILYLLLGDGVAASLSLALCNIFIGLEMYTCWKCWMKDTSWDVPWSVIVLWGLMSSQYFFATGHQATVPTIKWEAAFTGFHGDFESHILPGLLIHLNTFASEVLVSLTLPLILCWPLFRTSRYSIRKGSSDNWNEGADKGELVLIENSVQFQLCVFKLGLGYVLFHAVKLLGSMLAAAVLRRHLMVWKIFAPRFIFQSVSFITIYVVVIMSVGLMQHVHSHLGGWLNRLEKTK
ncbi:GPI ethanolamine phosphate transferase 3 [Lingula anatina]|uniref:GPI ethanolamine phosphate transferase 3, catalytic subunit n=1 Tax=Lingula anatina TaxID=7574 RepID=A0A1S3IYN1_LINAN|nr:GPI ethanolamine phosphate transferase 3 [Lingula anatina]|eukprot:XP_013403091.1 GPI ethanolamine phosphate transferase 3 [Lingula anatina]